MKKPFNKALAPIAAACALATVSVSATANEEMAFGLIISEPNLTANSTASANLGSANSVRRMNAIMGAQGKHKRSMFNGASVFRFDDGMKSVAKLEKMAQKLRAKGYIVDIDRLHEAKLTPNDTHYGVQWHYSDATGGINAPAAWDITTGTGVNVAVLDTGYRPHVDLAANIVGGYDFVSDSSRARDGNGRDSDARDEGDWNSTSMCRTSDSSWHGTHVSGTVAAVTNNNTGVAGVAFGAKVVPVRVLAQCGGSTSDIADAIAWSSGASVSGVPANPNPAKVINLSLGASGTCPSVTQNAINTARSNGSVVVVAAGNSNSSGTFTPASCNGVINVAATDRNGNRATYSNYGSRIDIAAPGGMGGSDGVASTMNAGTTTPTTDTYAYNAGTSMAAPHVAGVAALMFAVNPNLTPDQVEQMLKDSARSFPSGSTCSTSNCGAGIMDAHAAVLAAQGNGGGGPVDPPAGDNVLVKGVAKTGLSGASKSDQFFTIDVPAGATNLTFNMTGGTGDADLYVRKGANPTRSTYDCRSWASGNTESCTFATPATDTYHVLVHAYSAFSGASLTANYTEATTNPPGGGSGTQTVTNNTNYTISDNSTVNSPVTVSGRSGSLTDVEVKVDIKHTYIGDLIVTLVAPDGKSVVLHNRSGGSANNILQTYTKGASAVTNSGNGEWKLKVEDKAGGDTGYIDSWTLTFK